MGESANETDGCQRTADPGVRVGDEAEREQDAKGTEDAERVPVAERLGESVPLEVVRARQASREEPRAQGVGGDGGNPDEAMDASRRALASAPQEHGGGQHGRDVDEQPLSFAYGLVRRRRPGGRHQRPGEESAEGEEDDRFCD